MLTVNLFSFFFLKVYYVMRFQFQSFQYLDIKLESFFFFLNIFLKLSSTENQN